MYSSKTTRMFRPVRQVAASVGYQTTVFGRDRTVAGGRTGGESLPSPTASCCLSVLFLASLVLSYPPLFSYKVYYMQNC